MRVAVTLKNEAFKEEDEWRLVSRPLRVKYLEFRPGVSMLIPFFKFALGEDRTGFLDSVRIGPTPHPDLAAASVRMLLRRLNVLEPESRVAPTMIPFRSW